MTALEVTTKPILKFAVLEAGTVTPNGTDPTEAAERYRDYTSLYKAIFSFADSSEDWHQYRCYLNEFPNEDDLDSYRGFVVSGSRHDAHSDVDFIVRLRALVATIHNRQKSNLVGICFGHQLIAHALGGQSGRATEMGWQLGIQSIQVTPECQERFPKIPKVFNLIKIHQDQVKSLPPGSTRLASSSKCQYEMFLLGDRIICVQGHPEFSADLVSGLIRSRLQRGAMAEAVALPALQTLEQLKPETQQVSSWLSFHLSLCGLQFRIDIGDNLTSLWTIGCQSRHSPIPFRSPSE